MIRSTVIGIIAVMAIAKVATLIRQAPTSWEEREETVTWSPKTIKAYEIRNSNGEIAFEGIDETAREAELVVTKRAGAVTRDRAREALNSIETTIEGKNGDRCRIGWRWKRPRESDWWATVTLKVRSPGHVNLDAESQNGRIAVEHLAGDAKLATNNGQIEAETTGNGLEIQAKNGRIETSFRGKKIKIRSNNGQIVADLSHCRDVEGQISNGNGLTEVTVGKDTACELSAMTHRGHVSCDARLNIHSTSSSGFRHSMSGTLGSGGGKLTIECNNGAIFIR